MFRYKATGIVWGNLWGGGQAGYAAETLFADSLEDLTQAIDAGVKDGSLDSGMGFESLVGAYMTIEVSETRIIDGKAFIHVDETEYISSDLSENVQDFLSEQICCV